jgi:nucleoside-diphosphate-sugar epimerase
MGGGRLRIFITGGAGYIGSRLVPLLLAKGHHVTVLDNFRYGQPSLSQYCKDKNLDLETGDVRDALLVSRLTRTADVVIPLAAIVGTPACKIYPEESNEINVTSLRTLVGSLHRDQMVIYPSTNSVYGSGDISRPCTEESGLNPISLYSRQKMEAETIVQAHASSVCLRLATVFGLSERMRFDLLINHFVFKAVIHRRISIFEGHYKRNFLHISDAARVFQEIIERNSLMFGNIYNFGLSDVNLNKLEICNIIKEFIPDLEIEENANSTDPDQRNYVVSNKKIEKVGIKAFLSLNEGIYELVKGSRMYVNGHYSNV